MHQITLTFQTQGREIINITQAVNQVIQDAGATKGLCHLFIQHTSASLIICENFDPDVRVDLENFMSRLVPDGDPLFQHIAEGKDDMPSHVRTILTNTSLLVPVQGQQLALGKWQGLYLWEHRLSKHERKILLTVF